MPQKNFNSHAIPPRLDLQNISNVQGKGKKVYHGENIIAPNDIFHELKQNMKKHIKYGDPVDFFFLYTQVYASIFSRCIII